MKLFAKPPSAYPVNVVCAIQLAITSEELVESRQRMMVFK